MGLFGLFGKNTDEDYNKIWKRIQTEQELFNQSIHSKVLKLEARVEQLDTLVKSTKAIINKRFFKDIDKEPEEVQNETSKKFEPLAL